MYEQRDPVVNNWFGDIQTRPRVVVKPTTIDEIVTVLKNPDKYPSPLRAVGSNHSVTRCTVADGGTQIDMTGFTTIVQIGPDFVTAQAGALYIDVAKELEKRNLQFYVNIELGNLTIGSGACCGTKDGSHPGEFGQVNAYCTAMKLITPAGEIMEVTEAKDPELMQALRSSYGLMGIVFEATFRVRRLSPLIVENVPYTVDGFVEALPSLLKGSDALMFYLNPYVGSSGSMIVELSRFGEPTDRPPSRLPWKLRNLVWKNLGPGFSHLCTAYIPSPGLRYGLVDTSLRLQQWSASFLVKGQNTRAPDQTIRYPHRGGVSKYSFSLWGFPEEAYGPILKEYVRFSRDHFKRTGYRNDVFDVGFRVGKDTKSLLSYTYDGTRITIDPVSTCGPGWNEYLVAYNEFCSRNGGAPLFNQTPFLTHAQVKKALGPRLETFLEYRKRFDPGDRLLSPYFSDFLWERVPAPLGSPASVARA